MNNYIIYIFILLIFVIIVYFNQKHIKNKLNQKGQNWEKIQNDNYFNFFNKYDFKFRECYNKQKCKNLYLESYIPFSNFEEKKILEIINNFNKLINFKYRDIFKEINFIKVDNNIESSMPHTRKDAIIFSQSLFNRIIYLFEKDSNDLFFPKLLSHEMFHIFQRKNPKKIGTLYRDYWKMEKYMNELPSEILKINRTNPDALPDNNWLFKTKKGFILPLCVYRKKSSSLRDTENIYIRLNKNKKFINLQEDLYKRNLLINNIDFVNFFGQESANNYHANEISSSLFEKIIEIHILKIGSLKNKSAILLNKFLEIEI
tara:strand:+ start:375 stop:1322 length:948 start_codon:yes stop_codon:yes gene_type:complete